MSTTPTPRRGYTTEEGVEMHRISWATFYRLRPDLRPEAANDNEKSRTQAAPGNVKVSKPPEGNAPDEWEEKSSAIGT